MSLDEIGILLILLALTATGVYLYFRALSFDKKLFSNEMVLVPSGVKYGVYYRDGGILNKYIEFGLMEGVPDHIAYYIFHKFYSNRTRIEFRIMSKSTNTVLYYLDLADVRKFYKLG